MHLHNSLSIEFKELRLEDIPTIVEALTAIGWHPTASIYEGYLQEQSKGERDTWGAWQDSIFLGYVTLKWESEYEPFRLKKIPEIKDLNVLPQFRNQGIGSKLLDLAEQEAYKKGTYVGLSVGLSSDYGAAQKIYIARGYAPDGLGLTHNNKPVQPGTTVQIDDDLVLWLVKRFSEQDKLQT